MYSSDDLKGLLRGLVLICITVGLVVSGAIWGIFELVKLILKIWK